MQVLVNGVQLFFDVEGAKLVPDGPVMREKPTLLLLHGGPGFDHSIYKPAYSALADIVQIIYLDHRGNGRSEDGPRESWNLPQWGDDVRAFCDILGIASPIVLGVSFGGVLALEFAARYPHRLDRSRPGDGSPCRCTRAFRAIRTRRAARSAGRRCCIGSQDRAAKPTRSTCSGIFTASNVQLSSSAVKTIRSIRSRPRRISQPRCRRISCSSNGFRIAGMQWSPMRLNAPSR